MAKVSTNTSLTSTGTSRIRMLSLLFIGGFVGFFISAFAIIGMLFMWFGAAQGTSSISPRQSTSYDLGVTDSSKNVSGAPVVGNTEDRKVTTNYLSAHVRDTKEYATKITSAVTGAGGKVMSENITTSTDGQAANGTMRVLVPNDKVNGVLDTMTVSSIKIVDRNVNSYQITQEYTDLQRRLTQYEETYSRLQGIYNKATTVEDILKVQREMDNVLAQIDSVKGRIRALTELSENTQITVYFSTNEYSLPYVPTGAFQFEKTFKLAVRALVGTVDFILAAAIWFVVFIPVLAIPVGILWLLVRWLRAKIK
jgi:virulence-associated protein VapD